MRFLWYWPFARPEELDLASAATRPREHITVQVIDRAAAPPGGEHGQTTVVRNLPDVARSGRMGARWALSRAGTYVRRERARRAMWRTGDFDLVHLHYLNRFTDAWSALPRPLVVSVHDVVPHVPRLGRSLERKLLSAVYRRADLLIVHHRRLADRLMAEFGTSGSRIRVVPHQVFPVGAPPGVPPVGTPDILFFGALRANKGLEDLLAAMGAMPPEVTLTIAGRGEPHLEAMARSAAGLDPRVRAEIDFVSLERKRELFRSAHLVVLPYRGFSSQSGVLHDAYGHHRPVVVTDVGALGDTVREDETGLVVPARNPTALAAAMLTALQADTWQDRSHNAARIAEARSPRATGRLLRDAYDDVLT